MPRPLGVTIIAVLYFISAAFMVLAALALFGAGAMGVAAGGMGGGMLIGLGAVGGVIFLVLAALCAVLGWGLLQLKEWARIVVIVLTGIGAGFAALGMMASLISFEIFSFIWQAIWLAIYGYIVWYLLQPEVKRAFVPITAPPGVGPGVGPAV